MFDVMCDIETGGLSPDHSPILQIAAVRFNIITKEVDAGNMFNRCLALPPNRFWEEGTRHWWSQQNRNVLMSILDKAEKPETVMQDFANWAGYSHEEPLRFWAKPISFDYTFVSSYFRQFDIPNPFHFRHAVDLNSFLRGIHRGKQPPKSNVEFQGDVHNALFDVIYQIELAFEGLNHA